MSSTGALGDAGSVGQAMDASGRYVLFQSDATNLATGDANGSRDLFVRDRVARTTQLVSTTPAGVPGNGVSVGGDISDDGRFAVFLSAASNLVPGDTNGRTDVFVHDLVVGTTTRVSVNRDGRQIRGAGPWATISGDGRFVVFNTRARMVRADRFDGSDLYVYDRLTGKVTLESVNTQGEQGTLPAGNPRLSRHGRKLVFQTRAALSRRDDQHAIDVYVRNRSTGVTKLVHVAADGTATESGSLRASISGDGTKIVYEAAQPAGCCFQVFLRNTRTGRIKLVSRSSSGEAAERGGFNPAISSSGRWLVFESWPGRNLTTAPVRQHQVYLRDLRTAATELVSVDDAGTPAVERSGSLGLLSVSDDGTAVVFTSTDDNLAPPAREPELDGVFDVFVRDRS